jgi:hypothetical protein
MHSLDHLIDDERHPAGVARSHDSLGLPIAGLRRRLTRM